MSAWLRLRVQVCVHSGELDGVGGVMGVMGMLCECIPMHAVTGTHKRWMTPEQNGIALLQLDNI